MTVGHSTAGEKLIAVIDVGKTHVKLSLVETGAGQVVRHLERPSASIMTDLGAQLDLRGIEQWLAGHLSTLPERARVAAIVPVAHGAAAVLLDAGGAPLAALDYDRPEFDALASQYRPLRDDFAVTLSPLLPRGLNLGRQLYWLQQREPALWARCTHILTYAQYWAWRFSGQRSCELTSLGCHTDLWRPVQHRPSELCVRRGWHDLLAPVHRAGDVLGTVTTDWVRRGLPADCRVVCGIHDSNASYAAQALTQPADAAFVAVSSGTWTVAMARGAPLERLVQSRDMLANVDAWGRAVATARFPGGLEYRAISGAAAGAMADERALARIFEHRVLAVPGFADNGGPFARHVGRVIREESLTAAGRVTLATLYVALMTDLVLDNLGTSGDVLLDGPLAESPVYAAVLASLRHAHGQQVRCMDRRHGTSQAALYLAGYPREWSLPSPVTLPDYRDALLEYRAHWRAALPEAH